MMAREKSSVEELYRLHIQGAVKLAYVLTEQRQLAEDIAQEAFVRVMGRFGNLRKHDAFTGYLRRTIVNLANSHYRRRRIERLYLDRLRGKRPTHATLPDVEQRQDLMARLAKLPWRQRIALVLHYYEDLSELEVGDALGISASAAKSLIARGMRSLRNQTLEHIS